MARQSRTLGVARPLYDRVQREVAERDWTDTRLQEETGVYRSTIDAWKRSTLPPRRPTVRKVAEALGIDFDEALALAGIIEDESDAEPDEPPGPPLHNDEERDFWALMIRSRVPAEMAVAQLEMFKASRRQAQ